MSSFPEKFGRHQQFVERRPVNRTNANLAKGILPDQAFPCVMSSLTSHRLSRVTVGTEIQRLTFLRHAKWGSGLPGDVGELIHTAGHRGPTGTGDCHVDYARAGRADNADLRVGDGVDACRSPPKPH